MHSGGDRRGRVDVRSPPFNADKGKQSMKSKLKNKLVAFFKEAIRAAVAAEKIVDDIVRSTWARCRSAR